MIWLSANFILNDLENQYNRICIRERQARFTKGSRGLKCKLRENVSTYIWAQPLRALLDHLHTQTSVGIHVFARQARLLELHSAWSEPLQLWISISAPCPLIKPPGILPAEPACGADLWSVMWAWVRCGWLKGGQQKAQNLQPHCHWKLQ